MRSPVGIKEEPAVTPPATSAVVAGTVEAQQSLKKGPWTAAEDAILIEYVRNHGEGNWNAVQKNTGLLRCGKSCRLRWANHLRPNLKKGSFSPEEEDLILQLHAQLGNKWARMAAQLPGRTDNEIKNYWNTRIKRRQRAGLPLYPPEIQRQVALMNQRQGTLMLLQNQIRPKNFISHVTPTTVTLFNNTNANDANTNYLLGNFNLSLPPQQLQSPTFPFKMELPSTQLFPGCASDQKLLPLPTPPVLGQENNVLFDDLFQESQGPGELHNEGFFFEPLAVGCAAMAKPLSPPSPPPPSLPSNSKHSVMDPLRKLGNSDISIGIHIMKQPVETMVNQDVSNLPEMNPVHTTVMPAEKLLSDWCDLSPSSGMTEDDLRVEMQQLASNLSMAHDWSFETSSWENMPCLR